MRQAQGYILLWVMCCLQLLSAISLYELSHVTSYIKTTKNHQLASQSHQLARRLLKELEENFSTIPPACFMEISPVTWVEEGIADSGCKGEYKSYSYAYFVTLLDINNCDFIDINHTLTAKYYRITLRLLTATNSLQSVIVRPNALLQDCKGEPHQVTIGRQQWREI